VALALEAVPVDQLFRDVCNEISQASRVIVKLPDRTPLASLKVPRHPVQQALIALLKNALDASPCTSPVLFTAECSGEFLQFRVKDAGPGMPAEILQHVGEPFFTTKEVGKGMGLGTFVARTLAEQLGGSLKYESAVGAGTVAVFELPITLKAEA
jgi:two-component system sensor histidine kinase RegB